MAASTSLSITFTAAEPAPARATPVPPLLLAEDTATPMASAPTRGLPTASTVTLPAATTLDLLMPALSLLRTSLRATPTPTDRLPAVEPRLEAKATATPKASARSSFVASVASRRTSPPVEVEFSAVVTVDSVTVDSTWTREEFSAMPPATPAESELPVLSVAGAFENEPPTASACTLIAV